LSGTKPPRPPGRPKGVKEKRARRPRGEGSLRERSPGVWQFRIRHDGHVVTRTVHGTRAQAVAAMTEQRAELAKRGTVRRDARTVRDLAADWWNHRAAPGTQLARRTLEGDASQLRLWILPYLGDIRLDRLKARDIDLMYRAMSQKGLAPSSQKRAHAVLAPMLAQAMKWDWIDANPLGKTEVPKNRRREIQPPATVDVDRVIRAAPGQWRVMFRLAAASGMRRGELCGFQWADLDWSTGMVLVCRSIAATRTSGLQVKTTKTGKWRRFGLDAETVQWLRVLASERVGQVGELHGFVFSPDGGHSPFSPDSATQQFGRVRDEVGVKGVRLHDLRHWHASYLLTSGQPVPRVQQRLGHDHASTTLEFYGHLVEDPQAFEAAEVIGELLAGG
jgi:integrase